MDRGRVVAPIEWVAFSLVIVVFILNMVGALPRQFLTLEGVDDWVTYFVMSLGVLSLAGMPRSIMRHRTALLSREGTHIEGGSSIMMER